jgi:hypothetical protein
VAVHLQEAPDVACYAVISIMASQGLIEPHDLVFKRFMPSDLQQLLEFGQTALYARLDRFPSHLDIAPVVTGAVQGKAEKRARLQASPAPFGVPFGKTAEGHHTGLRRLQSQGKLRQALDECLLETLCVGRVLETHDAIINGADQVRLTVQPWLHNAFEPEVHDVVQIQVAQHDAYTAPLRQGDRILIPCIDVDLMFKGY